MGNRPFEEIEAQTIGVLKRQGFVVQRTFSLSSAMGAGRNSTDGNPGYSVLLLYAAGTRRQPLGLVTLYEWQGRTVIHSLLTPLVEGSRPSPADEDVEAELAAALTFLRLDFTVGPDGQAKPISPKRLAGQKTEPEEEVMHMLKDPVCGKRINRHRAQAAIEYEGVVYYVCCPLCQSEFESDPDRYARPELGQKVRPVKREQRRR